GLVKVYRKANPLVKGKPGQPLTINQFDLTDRRRCLLEKPLASTEVRRQWLSGGGQTAAGYDVSGERGNRRRFLEVCRGAWSSRADGGKTSGGSSGFVRAPIAVWSMSMASPLREKHDGGLACTRL
ncbi:unnamed protein product, partial [Brassica rapa]